MHLKSIKINSRGKNMKIYTVLISVVALLLLGCATNKSGYKTEAAVENRLYQMNKTDVLTDLGPPNTKADLGQGKEAWRYSSEVGGLTGGECTLSIVFDGNKVSSAKLSANDLSWVSFPLGSCTKIIQTLR
jgi:hypothetical protein